MAPPSPTGVPEPRDAAVGAAALVLEEAVRVVTTWQPAWDRHGPSVLAGLSVAGRPVDSDAVALLLADLARSNDVPFDPLAALLLVGLHRATRRERALVAAVLIDHGVDGERARCAAGLDDTAHLPARGATTPQWPSEPLSLYPLVPSLARHLLRLHGGAAPPTSRAPPAPAASAGSPLARRQRSRRPSRSSTDMHAGFRPRRYRRRPLLTVCALSICALTVGGAALTWSVRSRDRSETALLIPPNSVPSPWVLTSATSRLPLFVLETSAIEQTFLDGERSIRLVIDVSTRVYEDPALGAARSPRRALRFGSGGETSGKRTLVYVFPEAHQEVRAEWSELGVPVVLHAHGWSADEVRGIVGRLERRPDFARSGFALSDPAWSEELTRPTVTRRAEQPVSTLTFRSLRLLGFEVRATATPGPAVTSPGSRGSGSTAELFETDLRTGVRATGIRSDFALSLSWKDPASGLNIVLESLGGRTPRFDATYVQDLERLAASLAVGGEPAWANAVRVTRGEMLRGRVISTVPLGPLTLDVHLVPRPGITREAVCAHVVCEQWVSLGNGLYAVDLVVEGTWWHVEQGSSAEPLAWLTSPDGRPPDVHEALGAGDVTWRAVNLGRSTVAVRRDGTGPTFSRPVS